jgi:hypothetical protein
MGSSEGLPPRWRDNMRERRACLFRYRCDESLTPTEAESVAEELIADNGKGRWDFRVVQLDEGGCEWEFRFKPRLANVVRYPGRPRR